MSHTYNNAWGRLDDNVHIRAYRGSPERVFVQTIFNATIWEENIDSMITSVLVSVVFIHSYLCMKFAVLLLCCQVIESALLYVTWFWMCKSLHCSYRLN